MSGHGHSDKLPKQLMWLILIIIMAAIVQIFPQNKELNIDLTDKTELSQDPNAEISVDDYEVVKVVDGDTIDVLIGEQKVRIRLIGVDTPETVDPRKPVQCFGKEASKYTEGAVGGKKVKLEKDSSQGESDRYGRLLAYVYMPDGQMLNRKLIVDGYAHEYTYNIPYKYQKDFKDLQNFAERQGRGLWAPGACDNY